MKNSNDARSVTKDIRVFLRAACATLLLAGMTSALSAREQIVIQKSATDAQARGGSIFLNQHAANTAQGDGVVVNARTSGGGRLERSLLLFDLSALPPIAVKQATLTLHVITAPTSGRTYGAHALTNFWTTNATWNSRTTTANGLSDAWGAAGGDFNGTATATATVSTASNVNVTWDISADLQTWYQGTSANYGTLIMDENEGSNRSTVFGSFGNGTQANRPSLAITYLQNATNLTATPGNGSVALTWTNPTPITGATVLEPYAGVVILRRAGAPVDKGAVPPDGTAETVCNTVGSGTVVFVGTSSNTSFTDSGTCGALTNGTLYFYKIFTKDSANNYSANGTDSAATAEIGAIPGTTQKLDWTVATHSSNLGGGGLIPGAEMVFGSDTSQLFAIDLTTGTKAYPPVALGGTVSARPPVLDPAFAVNGKQVAYVTGQDGFVYAVDTSATGKGQILWASDLSAQGAAGNIFMGGAGVLVQAYTGGNTPGYDVVIVGTHNTSTGNPGTINNSVFGLNGTTGTVVWTMEGATGGHPSLDWVNSTPAVDYVNGAAWVTSESNGGTSQPDLWKLNPTTGAVIWSTNLAASGNGDIDSSPSLTQSGDVLFVGANNGSLYAVNPAAASGASAKLATYSPGDGAVTGFPFVVNNSSPYTIIFTTSTMVQAVTYDKNTKTFTKLWSSQAFLSPSAPVVDFYTNKIYIGSGCNTAQTTCSDTVYELALADGSVTGSRLVDTGNNPMYIGDPSLDLVLGRVYITTTTNDQRTYAYDVPF